MITTNDNNQSHSFTTNLFLLRSSCCFREQVLLSSRQSLVHILMSLANIYPCFLLLHFDHLEFLQWSKLLKNFLTTGVSTSQNCGLPQVFCVSCCQSDRGIVLIDQI